MIAVDTNLLVYAHREDSDWHREAIEVLKRLAEGADRWAIPWPCVHEFLAILTHLRIYTPRTPLPIALEAVRVWLECPSCRMIGEGPEYFQLLAKFAVAGKATRPQIHDARIAAIRLANGVRELWTSDRDFSRFRELKTMNPLVRRARRSGNFVGHPGQVWRC